MKYRETDVGQRVIRARDKRGAVIVAKHDYVELIDVCWDDNGKTEERLKPTDFDLYE